MSDYSPAPQKTKEEIAEAYSSHPWWYDVRGFFILTFAYRSTLGQQLRFFGNHMQAPHLEVAIGTGTLFELILRWRKWKKLPTIDTVGIDYAEPMLKGAEVRFAKEPSVSLKHADVAQLPFPDESFKTINIANAVHCFPDVEGAFKDVMRVLQVDGTVAANVLLYPDDSWPLGKIAKRINDWGMRKGILYRPYHADEIRSQLAAVDAVIVEESIKGNTYSFIAKKA